MWMTKFAIPTVVSLGVVCIVTIVLWHFRLAGDGKLLHPVFIYLPLIALVALVYGGLPALVSALAATAFAAFFLYDPVYSFRVANHLEIGDLVWFALLAVIGVKCTCEFLRPARKIRAGKSRSIRF
jgi:K+-sensing histidine kinase KdpD